ncbi:hypothetical protein EZV62_009176 [Acer yangbiense]|uniref:Uncharacterized protein n=1 Tax=Acer yangbiense TaxID=1000413 RepID=A0A5C7IFJ9_9ROSI|nr:hypothetical protein EZV62_009176 [Acer yangbiense]
MALKTSIRRPPSSLLFSALKCKHFSQKPTNSNSKNDLSSVFNNPEAIDRLLKDKCRSEETRSSHGILHYFFNALVKNNHHETVISLFKRFNSTGLLPNLILFNVLLNCVCNRGRACDGFVVLERILRLGFSPDAVTFTSLIKCLCKEGRIMKAIQLFKNMNPFGCRPNVITYGTLIQGLCQNGNTNVALKLHELMVKGNGENGVMCLYFGGKREDAKDLIDEIVDQHVHPNVVTFTVIIDDFCKNGKIDKANELLELMVKRGVNPDIVTYNTLIDGLCLIDKIDDARELFVSMINNGCRHDAFSYNIMINGYCKKQNINEAMSLYREMISKGVVPNVITYNTFFIDGLCKNGCIVEAMELLDILKKDKFILSIKSYNCVIDGLCKTGRLKIARKLFHELPQEGLEPNIVTYNIMVHGLCKEGKLEEANDLLSIMEEEDIDKDMACLAVHSGTATLKDAMSEAVRDWVTNVETTHYILGSVDGPHPYPMMVREFHAVDVRLIGVEAAGHGLDSGKHAATPKGNLDYPRIGPEHSFLKDEGHAEYYSVTDDEALEGMMLHSILHFRGSRLQLLLIVYDL